MKRILEKLEDIRYGTMAQADEDVRQQVHDLAAIVAELAVRLEKAEQSAWTANNTASRLANGIIPD